MITLNKTIRLFLDGIGRREEYEFYLNRFQAANASCFALLCPDRRSIEIGTEVLAFDLHFLIRLGLLPAILLCGKEATAMRKLLSAEPLFVFQSFAPDTVDEFIQHAREVEKLPVLLAEKMELEEALLKLLPHTARRVHFIRAAGGLKNSRGELLPYFYTQKPAPDLEPLEFDYPALAGKLLMARPGTHLSLTSPIRLLEEIFTVEGAGTLFRKGSEIHAFNRLEGIDRERLIALFENSFGKKLTTTAFMEDVAHTYLEQHYRGAVLLEDTPAGLYLSKFAVDRTARGEGLALELWREVCKNHPAFFWRSARTNSFNSWYQKQADGQFASEKWMIFWRGISAEHISPLIHYALHRPEDFVSGQIEKPN